jgi:hypothetical protein
MTEGISTKTSVRLVSLWELNQTKDLPNMKEYWSFDCNILSVSQDPLTKYSLEQQLHNKSYIENIISISGGQETYLKNLNN